jgi:nicotinamidase-related amidase
MKTMTAEKAALLIVDFQSRLMPAIADAAPAIANARRLIDAAALLKVPVLFTEQNPKGLGPTLGTLNAPEASTTHKMSFDACREAGFLGKLKGTSEVVVAGCEAHVCVLQTVLGLLYAGFRVFCVRDAIGARQPASKEAALRRMQRHGADVVTTEMVIFEWLGSCENSQFRNVLPLVK